MDQQALDLMIRLFEGSRDFVCILDKNWKTVWRSGNLAQIDDLPKHLYLAEDCWDNLETKITLGEHVYDCSLRCSREDGIRVLQIHPPSEESALDIHALTEILQGMITNLTAHHRYLDDDAALDQLDYFNSAAGSILRIYRMIYLSRQIGQGKNGGWSGIPFSLRKTVQNLYKDMRSILRTAAHIEFHDAEEPLFIEGDPETFRNAVLAAFLLCIRKPEQFQTAELRLYRDGEDACLEIRVKAESEQRRDMDGQLHHFGTDRGERELIDVYSKAFGTQFLFLDEDGASCCRIRTKIADEPKFIALHSEPDRTAGGFYDDASVMLSRFCYRRYF